MTTMTTIQPASQGPDEQHVRAACALRRDGFILEDEFYSSMLYKYDLTGLDVAVRANGYEGGQLRSFYIDGMDAMFGAFDSARYLASDTAARAAFALRRPGAMPKGRR